MKDRAVCHLNVIGFRSAVAIAKDKSLRGRPFVIAGSSGGRSLALDCSPEAIRQGIMPGTALAAAEKKIADLMVLAPDISSYEIMNRELEKVAAHYAPVWENDRTGNVYLDITGTTGLFGAPVDCSSRILKEVFDQTGIRPAAAVSANKLVSKVATRTVRPTGLIQVQAGTEAHFLCHQDIRILPGMGAKLLRTASVTGMREIGDIAALSVSEAAALFGKQGHLLRNMALGIDERLVEEKGTERRIIQQADFDRDVIDETAIRGAIETLCEHGGLIMRRDKLGAAMITLTVIYADGVRAEGREKGKRLYVLDKDIFASAERIFFKIAVRRLRIRSIGLVLEGLLPLGYEPDLFEIEDETKDRSLQEAVDKIRTRFGEGKLMKGLVFEALNMQSGQLLLN